MSLIKIEINNLTKKYKHRYIFNQYNLTIDNQHCNIISGCNGSGKTTLIKCITQMIKYKGKIENEYQYVYMPDYVNLPKSTKLHTFLKLISEVVKVNKRNTFKYYLKEFNLLSHLHKKIKSLSLGTKQKIILIKTLIEDVDIYIFDEPLNGLDDQSIDIFNSEINKLLKEEKLVIIICHNKERIHVDNTMYIKIGNENI